jgi:[acyl-carrier-protein] S-malonyltransferase
VVAPLVRARSLDRPARPHRGRRCLSTEIGHVEQRGRTAPDHPAVRATVLEWLVEDGDPVSAGQPLVRLQPDPIRPGR